MLQMDEIYYMEKQAYDRETALSRPGIWKRRAGMHAGRICCPSLIKEWFGNAEQGESI